MKYLVLMLIAIVETKVMSQDSISPNSAKLSFKYRRDLEFFTPFRMQFLDLRTGFVEMARGAEQGDLVWMPKDAIRQLARIRAVGAEVVSIESALAYIECGKSISVTYSAEVAELETMYWESYARFRCNAELIRGKPQEQIEEKGKKLLDECSSFEFDRGLLEFESTKIVPFLESRATDFPIEFWTANFPMLFTRACSNILPWGVRTSGVAFPIRLSPEEIASLQRFYQKLDWTIDYTEFRGLRSVDRLRAANTNWEGQTIEERAKELRAGFVSVLSDIEIKRLESHWKREIGNTISSGNPDPFSDIATCCEEAIYGRKVVFPKTPTIVFESKAYLQYREDALEFKPRTAE